MAATVAELQVVVSADTKSADSSLTSFSSKLGSVGGTMATAFGAAAIGGVVALAGGLVAATASAADFEAEMSAIKAVSGATGAEMEALQAKALQLGADTSFSASEAASGIEELLKAGVSVADVMGGGAAAALNLAAAGGISVSESATIASDALNAFGLKGADAAHVADLLAGASVASSADVHGLGQGLAAVGAVAHTVGLSIDDTTTSLALMAQSGVKGSDAGTSLKTMLLNLTPSTKAQIAVAKELGIVTADGANRFFDASGKAKGMSEVAQVLHESMAGLTKQQQLQALATLFGTDAIRAAAIMAEAGAEGYDKMAEAESKIGADEVAKTRLDNMKGAIEALGGSISTVAIKMGLQFTQNIRGIVDDLTGMVNDAGPLMEEFAASLNSGLISAIDTGKDAIRQLGDAWRTVQQVFAGDWSPDASIEPLSLAAGNAALKLRELSEWAGKVAEAAGKMGAWDNFVNGLKTLGVESEVAQANLGKIVGQLDRLTGAAGNSGASINLVAGAVKIVGVAFELWALSIGGAIDIMESFASEGLSFIGIVGSMGKALVAIAQGDMPAYNEAMRGVAQGVLEMATTHMGLMDRTAERAKQAFQAITGSATTETAATSAAVEAGMSEANQTASAAFLEMASSADADLGAMSAAATARFAELSASAGTGTAEAVSAVDSGMAAMGPAVDAGMAGAVAGVQAGGEQMTAAAGQGAAGAVAAVEGQTGAASGAGMSVGDAIGAGLRGGLLGWVGQVAAAAADLVSTAIGAARAAADAHSPSKKTEQLGKDMADGLEAGLAKANLAPELVSQIRDFMQAARDYVPTANEIARVEAEIKGIREASQTDALFRGQEMITVDSELLRLKRDQTQAERDMLPIRQDLAAADRDVRDIAAGSLEDRTRLLELETQHKQIRLLSLGLEQQLLLAGKDETRKKQIQGQIDALRDQDRALSLEQDKIRTTNDLASTSARMRSLGLGEILAAQERSTGGLVNQIAVLGAEKSVFEANEAIIKNATDNEIGYRNRLIAVFTAEGKPLADRITAGLLLVDQLSKEGLISDAVATKLKDLAKSGDLAKLSSDQLRDVIDKMDPVAATSAGKLGAMALAAADVARKSAEAAAGVDKLKGSSQNFLTFANNALSNLSNSIGKGLTPIMNFGGAAGSGAPTQSGGYPGGSIVPGQSTVPGGSIIPMSSSSVAIAPMQTIRLDVAVGGKVSKQMVIEGYDMAVREGWTPGGLTG